MRQYIWSLLIIATIAAVAVSGAVVESSTPPPCPKKAPPAKLLSIEQRYPTLVKDYHPVDDAIDPNMIPDKEADRTARVIIREHLAWEKENPAPPHQMSTEELKDLGLKIAEQTIEIDKEGKIFKALAKWVDDDHAAHIAADKAKVLKEAEDAKKKALEAAEKIKSAAMLKQVQAQSALVAQQKAKAEAARAAAAAKAAKAAGKPVPKAAAKKATKTAASAKINDLKNKITKNAK
jgi:hypothetical protein